MHCGCFCLFAFKSSAQTELGFNNQKGSLQIKAYFIGYTLNQRSIHWVYQNNEQYISRKWPSSKDGTSYLRGKKQLVGKKKKGIRVVSAADLIPDQLTLC